MTAPTLPAASPRAGVAAPARSARSVAWFVVLCLAIAAVATAITIAAPAMASAVPFLLALGPAVVAFGLAAREGDGAAKRLARSLWQRPNRAVWFIVIGLPVAWALTTVAIGAALGHAGPDLFPELIPAVFIVPLVVLLPAFAEEVAWRGYAVPGLARSISPLATALLLSIPWVVMHLPLHLPGGMNATAEVWPGVLSLVSYSVVLTWVVLGSGGSILLASVVHAGFNGFVPLMRGIDVEAGWVIRAVVMGGVAIAIVALGGYRELRPAAEGD